MKRYFNINDIVMFYQDNKVLYYVTDINKSNPKLVNLNALLDNQSLINIPMDNLTLDKHFLLRKISVVHAVKCNKLTSFQTAIDSFKKLNELKKLVEESLETNLFQLNSEVISWKDLEPIVSDVEMEQLLKSK